MKIMFELIDKHWSDWHLLKLLKLIYYVRENVYLLMITNILKCYKWKINRSYKFSLLL